MPSARIRAPRPAHGGQAVADVQTVGRFSDSFGCGVTATQNQVEPAEIETPRGPLPEAAELILERFYTMKVGSLQFCGPHNFGLSFWDGLEALALTLPGILWLSRAFTNLPREEAVALATRIVDNNFAFNPLFGSHRQRLALALLRFRGELEKLIAWYSR